MNDQNQSETKSVCGGILEDPEKYPSATYQGEILYFCHLGCLQAFEEDPERFLAGEIDHPPD